MYPDELVILLIEDNLAEAELLGELLLNREKTTCQIEHHTRLAAALRNLSQRSFDVILLDLIHNKHLKN